MLTCDVSGTSNITYIGDVTGEHTDGVGGVVRITGSDNDQTATRTYCITANGKNYRKFQGFALDTSTTNLFYAYGGTTNVTIQDCYFGPGGGYLVNLAGASQANHTVQRCIFTGRGATTGGGIYFNHTSDVDNCAHVVSDCLFLAGYYGVQVGNIGGVTVKNCTLIGRFNIGIGVTAALNTGQTLTVNNCIITGAQTGLTGANLGDIVEDYNTFFANNSDRNTCNTGSNSVTYPALFNPPLLLDGSRYPWHHGELSKWSQVARKAGSGEAADDLFGIARPATSSKNSWGAIQNTGATRETTTTQGSSAASLKLPDAGEQFLMRVPVTATSTTISLYCYREADYAGTNPAMIIRQPGQSDRTTTDTGSSATWNQLSDTFTPASLPPYVDIFVKSSNTATSGNYDAFFDTVSVS